MSYNKNQIIEIQFKIKDPVDPNPRRRKDRIPSAKRVTSPVKTTTGDKKHVSFQNVGLNQAIYSPPKAAYSPVDSARKDENIECVNQKRDKNHDMNPYCRDRVHSNTSGPVLKESSFKHTSKPEEPWVNKAILGSRSIMLIEQDEEISKYRYAKNPTTDATSPSFSSSNKRVTKDIPAYRSREKPNTNGAVLNLPRHPARISPEVLTPREQIVPDNGIIWNTDTVLDDENEAVKHFRAPSDMSREAFYEMYGVYPQRNQNKVVVMPAAGEMLGLGPRKQSHTK